MTAPARVRDSDAFAMHVPAVAAETTTAELAHNPMGVTQAAMVTALVGQTAQDEALGVVPIVAGDDYDDNNLAKIVVVATDARPCEDYRRGWHVTVEVGFLVSRECPVADHHAVWARLLEMLDSAVFVEVLNTAVLNVTNMASRLFGRGIVPSGDRVDVLDTGRWMIRTLDVAIGAP